MVKDSVTEASKTSATTSNELTNGVKDSADSTKPSGANPKVNEDDIDALMFLPLPGKILNGKAKSLRVSLGNLETRKLLKGAAC